MLAQVRIQLQLERTEVVDLGNLRLSDLAVLSTDSGEPGICGKNSLVRVQAI